MSQAEELLNSLSGTATTADTSSDSVIIDSERFLTVPENLKKLGVSPDHGVNTIHFIGPRYSENGSDLSTMSIYVNFMRADGYVDACPCTNVIVDSEDETLLHYDWEISRNVTEVHGNVTVLVCAKEVDAAGIEQDHWNTEMCTDFYVSEGFEVQDIVISQYPDLVEYMLLRVATVENKTTKAYILNCVEQYLNEDPSVIIEHIEKIIAEQPIDEFVKEYLDNYVDICTTENRTLENSHTGAYEMVSMTGVSEQARYEGYQLFDASKLPTTSASGATVTNNGDGSFTVAGSGTLTDGFIKVCTIEHDEFVKMFKVGTISLDTVNVSYPFFSVVIRNSEKFYFEMTNMTSASKNTELVDEILADEGSYVQICFYGSSGETIVPATIKPMLYQDGDGTWEPFTGYKVAPNSEYPQEIESVGPEVTIKPVNKNILKNTASDKTVYGVTFTVNDDGSVTANGTATENIFFNLGAFKLEPGDYKLSGCTGGSTSTYLLYIQKPGGVGYTHVTNGEKVFTAGDTDERHALIAVYKNVTVSNITFYPMISKDGGDYVKHQESSATISLVEPIRGKNDICDVIEKRNSKWGILRRWKKITLDAANFAEITWTEYENVTFFTLPKPEDSLVYNQYTTVDAMCDKFRCDIIHPLDQLAAIGNIDTAASAPLLWFGFEKGTALEVAQAIGAIEYIYQLAEPVWEELDAEAQFALDNMEVYDGITHVFVESGVQPVVTSTYGTSRWGARNIDNRRRIEMLEKLTGLGDTTPSIQIDISSGGTGGSTAAEARENLEVYSKAEVDALLGDINAVLESLIGG